MTRVPPGVAVCSLIMKFFSYLKCFFKIYPVCFQRITQYYSPYRVPQRSNSNSGRREDSSSGGPAASSSGGSSSQSAAQESSAPAASTATNRSTTAAPSTSTAPANQDTSPTSNSSKKGSETAEMPTLETAREQLALTFSILVRAGCDILSRMPRPVLSVYTKADDNAKRSQLKVRYCRQNRTDPRRFRHNASSETFSRKPSVGWDVFLSRQNRKSNSTKLTRSLLFARFPHPLKTNEDAKKP